MNYYTNNGEIINDPNDIVRKVVELIKSVDYKDLLKITDENYNPEDYIGKNKVPLKVRFRIEPPSFDITTNIRPDDLTPELRYFEFVLITEKSYFTFDYNIIVGPILYKTGGTLYPIKMDYTKILPTEPMIELRKARGIVKEIINKIKSDIFITLPPPGFEVDDVSEMISSIKKLVSEISHDYEDKPDLT
ncbi:MAG: hypothetical protein ACOCQD_02985 [archaeon]